MNKPILSDNYFCEKIRTKNQKKLIKKIRQTGQDIVALNLNWGYISQRDNLTINFIKQFEDYISFDKLSENPHLTIKHIRAFKNNLNWNILSKHYKFKLKYLLEFQHKVNWELVFFHQNLTSKDIQTHFIQQMWWLFPNDRIVDNVDGEYKRVNDMVIHKNVRSVTTQFSTTYHKKLEEYLRNREQLKATLKEELIGLIDSYQNDGTIKKMMNIQINLVDKKSNPTIEKGIQATNMEEFTGNPFGVSPMVTFNHFGEESIIDFTKSIMVSGISNNIVEYLENDGGSQEILEIIDEKLNSIY